MSDIDDKRDFLPKAILSDFQKVTGKLMYSKLQIKFKKLHLDAVTPTRATDGAAGFDLTAISVDVLDQYDGDYMVARYHTGIAVEIPKGYVGLLFPRSSCYKQGVILSNAVGVIDSDYRGEICLMFSRIQDHMEDAEQADYRVYDRIGQLVIVPCPDVEFVKVEELSQTERGAGGFGHTGR